MKVLNIPIYAEAIGQTDINVKNNVEALIYNVSETKGICHGTITELFNEELFEKYNLPSINAKFSGGAIVVFEGDVNVSQTKKGFSNFGRIFLQSANTYLKSKGLDSEVLGNDLIVHEGNILYKVGSFASCWVNNNEMLYTVIHLSNKVDLGLIKEICNKPMEKIPKGLTDYGITASEVLEYIKQTVDEFKESII